MRTHNAMSEYKKSNTAADRIHFLNTAASDAILIESCGKFALIDCAEDNDNPRGFKWLDYQGYEQLVLAYLKKNAAEKNEKIHLDFILGTHSHSDHIGGFDTVVSDPAVSVDRAYLKKYDENKINRFEVEKWDNKEVYNQMVEALTNKNIPIISELSNTPFHLGNFKITLYNTEDNDCKKVGENDRSLGILLEKDGTRIFLAGDIDNFSGDEKRLAPQIGKINLLKVGHHSYAGSTSVCWLKTLKPDTCIITNRHKGADKKTCFKIKLIARSDIFVTGTENGVIAEVHKNGRIDYFSNIHK